MDDEIIYEIYEEEGSWYQNIPPGYWFVVLFLNLGFFFFVKVEKMHPSYYAIQLIVSFIISIIGISVSFSILKNLIFFVLFRIISGE